MRSTLNWLGSSWQFYQWYWVFKAGYAFRLTITALASSRLLWKGFAGNDSPSFVFPTAIATKGGVGGAGGSGSGRPAVANKPSFLTGGAGGSNLSSKRGTEDLDFFIGDEALTAASGPGIVGLKVAATANAGLTVAKDMAFITQFAMVWLKIGYWLIGLILPNPRWPCQDYMERFWSNSIFKYLRVEPEDHYFLLTEPVYLLSPKLLGSTNHSL